MTLPFTEGYVPFRGARTWYRITGNLDSGATPLLLLHGGPGIPSNSYAPLEPLAAQRPVVRYDQLGCGRSDRPHDASLWTLPTFVEELATVRAALGLDRVHLLGHSWGGMLALQYLLGAPSGVESLVLSSALFSTQCWAAEALRLRSTLPSYIRGTMQRFEDGYAARQKPSSDASAGRAAAVVKPGVAPADVAILGRIMQLTLPLITASAFQRMMSWASRIALLRSIAYEMASMAFFRSYICRMPQPPSILFADYLARNQDVYEAMWGPSEWFPTGNLSSWNVEPRLAEIAVPTLILSGRYDEATPMQQERFLNGIPGSKWIVFEESAHLTFLEEPERYRRVLAQFLDEVDAQAVLLPSDSRTPVMAN